MDTSNQAEEIRALEQRRMKALRERDMKTAREIIAEDYQLIPPPGLVLTREQYLGGIEAGALRYHQWEAASEIDVRLYGDAAVIRYQARIEVESSGQRTPSTLYWFTDVYEKRNGHWRIVWSQGTQAAAS